MGAHAGVFRLEPGDPRALVVGREQPLEARLEWLHEVGIHAGQEVAGHLHDGDLGAGVDGAQLEADIAAAHQKVRDDRQVEGRSNPSRARRPTGGQGNDGDRAGGEDRVVEAEAAAASSPSSSRCRRRGTSRTPAARGRPGASRAAPRPGRGGPRPRSSRPQPLEVDLGRGEAHTEPLGLPRVADDARGVEQRLGWDAAAEEADAPELRFGVNEGDSTPRSAARKAAA